MKHTYLPGTEDALRTLGAQIGAQRRKLGWTMEDLADRLGVAASVVRRIERGAPSTKAGTLFEAAVITGVALFGDDEATRQAAWSRANSQLALLPSRVRGHDETVSDDF